MCECVCERGRETESCIIHISSPSLTSLLLRNLTVWSNTQLHEESTVIYCAFFQTFIDIYTYIQILNTSLRSNDEMLFHEKLLQKSHMPNTWYIYWNAFALLLHCLSFVFFALIYFYGFFFLLHFCRVLFSLSSVSSSVLLLLFNCDNLLITNTKTSFQIFYMYSNNSVSTRLEWCGISAATKWNQ